MLRMVFVMTATITSFKIGTASDRVTISTGRRLSVACAHQISPCSGVTKAPRRSWLRWLRHSSLIRPMSVDTPDTPQRFGPQSDLADACQSDVPAQHARRRNDLQPLLLGPRHRARRRGHCLLGSQAEPRPQYTMLQCTLLCTSTSRPPLGSGDLGWIGSCPCGSWPAVSVKGLPGRASACDRVMGGGIVHIRRTRQRPDCVSIFDRTLEVRVIGRDPPYVDVIGQQRHRRLNRPMRFIRQVPIPNHRYERHPRTVSASVARLVQVPDDNVPCAASDGAF
jgi:hypothetical protein